MFHELQFPDTPIGLTRATAWKSLADMAKAAGREPPIPDLLLDRDDHRTLTLTARAHPPSESKLRAAEHRADYAASVVSRYARDAALAEPEPPTPEEDIADLAEAQKAKEEVEGRLRTARQQANLRELRGDPRGAINEVKEIEKELDIVDDWVRRAEFRIKDIDNRRSRFANRFSTHWGRLSAAELAKVETRFKELRTKVGEFLQEACLELVELHYLRQALESSSAPLACDRDRMPASYANPDAEATKDEETVAEGDEEEADDEAEHATENAEDGEEEEEELVAAAPSSATAEPESAATIEERRKKVLELHASGMSGRGIAKQLGTHQTTVQRILKAAEPPPQVIQAVTTVDRFANSSIRTVRADGQPAAT